MIAFMAGMASNAMHSVKTIQLLCIRVLGHWHYWVMCSYVIDILQHFSSHLATIIVWLNLIIFEGGSEFLEQRYPVGTLNFVDDTFPSFIL